jgi:hypothetical protein
MPVLVGIVIFTIVVLTGVTAKFILPNLSSNSPTPTPEIQETQKPTPTEEPITSKFPSLSTPTPIPPSPTTPLLEPQAIASVREDKKAIIVEFSNLKNVASIYYNLTYTTNKREKGIEGTIGVKPQDQVFVLRRVLELGTSSQGVFTYDQNVVIADLFVKFTLTNKKVIESTQTVIIGQ